MAFKKNNNKKKIKKLSEEYQPTRDIGLEFGGSIKKLSF